MRMNVYLEDDRGAQLVYWVERSGAAIVGWFAAPRMFNQHIGVSSDSRVDVHFTYPADGDLHFSLKDQTSPTGDEIFETVFWDRVRRKTIVGGVRSVSEKPRNDADPGWHILMPSYRQRSLGDYAAEPLLFCFATTAIPVANGRVAASALDRLPRLPIPPSSINPIRVDSLGTGVINLSACLIGDGAPYVWPSDEVVWSDRDETRFPYIHLSALFIPTSTANEAA